MTILELREKRNKAWEAAKAFVETKRDKDGLLSAEDAATYAEMEQKVRDLQIENKVIFTGVRSDVNDLMQGMDVFLFPSLYEGLPVTMVEAQASGLKCIISDKVPSDSIISNNIKIINLDSDIKNWVDEIINTETKKRGVVDNIKTWKYDIKSNAKFLQEFYLGLEESDGNFNSIYSNIQ